MFASYDPKDNQQIQSMIGAFGESFQVIKSWEDIDTPNIVFCVDKQTAQEVGNLYISHPLMQFRHKAHTTYVFGENNSQKLSRQIIAAKENSKKNVELVTIPNMTIWAESAMAIVLYDIMSKKA